ncbi:unnamed protein product, partial [Effrenium voratum]
ALGLWSSMGQLRAAVDATAMNALVAALRPAAEWAHALRLLRSALDAKLADCALCNAVATCGRQEWQQAVAVLRGMLQAEVEPDIITFSAVISACEADGEWSYALYTLQEMVSRHISPNIIACNACIAACAAAGRWKEATRLLSSMPCRPDVVSYNSVLACERALNWRICVQLLEEMRTAGVGADAFTYNSAIAVLDSQWQVAVHLLREMASSQLQPDLVTYGAVVS